MVDEPSSKNFLLETVPQSVPKKRGGIPNHGRIIRTTGGISNHSRTIKTRGGISNHGERTLRTRGGLRNCRTIDAAHTSPTPN